jgi:hypothetical protein
MKTTFCGMLRREVWLKTDRCFGGSYCLHRQGNDIADDGGTKISET